MPLRAHLQEAVDFVSSHGALAPPVPVKIPYSELRKFSIPEGLAVYVADLFLHEVTDQVAIPETTPVLSGSN